MGPANKKIINWLKNKNQRFRENICAPIVFKLMDLIGFQRHLPFTCTGDDALSPFGWTTFSKRSMEGVTDETH